MVMAIGVPSFRVDENPAPSAFAQAWFIRVGAEWILDET
jgi:hypothetical protein